MKKIINISHRFAVEDYYMIENILKYISDPRKNEYVEKSMSSFREEYTYYLNAYVDTKYIDVEGLMKYVYSDELVLRELTNTKKDEELRYPLSHFWFSARNYGFEYIDEVLDYDYISPWFRHQYRDNNLILIDRKTKKKFRYDEFEFYHNMLTFDEQIEFGYRGMAFVNETYEIYSKIKFDSKHDFTRFEETWSWIVCQEVYDNIFKDQDVTATKFYDLEGNHRYIIECNNQIVIENLSDLYYYKYGPADIYRIQNINDKYVSQFSNLFSLDEYPYIFSKRRLPGTDIPIPPASSHACRVIGYVKRDLLKKMYDMNPKWFSIKGFSVLIPAKIDN